MNQPNPRHPAPSHNPPAAINPPAANNPLGSIRSQNPLAALRPPSTVMRMERLGAFHQTRLSFVRSIIRKIAREQWQINCTRFDLDEKGFGDAIFSIEAPGKEPGQLERYTVVFFTQHLDDEMRSDRVIAEAWDLAFALCKGDVDEEMLAELRANIPLQEAGRCSADVLVLSRANKSVRNFSHFVDMLAAGKQPDPQILAKVGYLYRTTAVYGNGKFGLADFARLHESNAFALPFSAQMFSVYMLRHFSIMQVNHLAAARNPETAVTLDEHTARYLGTGNATGLGMAPFLINHPQLISQWILNRETAIARVLYGAEVTPAHVDRFLLLVRRAQTHVSEIYTDDEGQAQRNCQLHGELGELDIWIRGLVDDEGASSQAHFSTLWQLIAQRADEEWSLEMAELLNSILLELYPELVDELEATMGVHERYELDPQMSVATLRELIESDYGWAIKINFGESENQHFFWYRSAEKEEPRLGERATEPGSEKEVRIDVARSVHECYRVLVDFQAKEPGASVMRFVMHHPEQKGIVRRVQSMHQTVYGDIQENLLGKECIPLHLLRCKLSFFGCSKFDPKSALWLRITLFQGAPLVHELAFAGHDDWFLPTAPTLAEHPVG